MPTDSECKNSECVNERVEVTGQRPPAITPPKPPAPTIPIFSPPTPSDSSIPSSGGSGTSEGSTEDGEENSEGEEEEEEEERDRQQCLADSNVAHQKCRETPLENHTTNLGRCSSASFQVSGSTELSIGADIETPLIKFLAGNAQATGSVEVSLTVQTLPLCMAIADSRRELDLQRCTTFNAQREADCPSQ